MVSKGSALEYGFEVMYYDVDPVRATMVSMIVTSMNCSSADYQQAVKVEISGTDHVTARKALQ